MNDNKNQNGKRQLKVLPKYKARVNKAVIVPEIRLCGKWLQNAGFTTGQSVSVVSEPNKLTITLDSHA